MEKPEAELDPLDQLSDDVTALHTESDRRDSYRYGVRGERARGLLQIGLAEVPVEIVDESAGGFSVAFLEGPACELNQTLLLRLGDGWIEVRVMNVRTEHKLRDDGETLLRTRLGLKRIRDLEEWEVLQWQHLRLAVVSEGLRKVRLKTLRRPLLTIVLPILGVLLVGAGLIWVLEHSAPTLEDLAHSDSTARARVARLNPPGDLPIGHSGGRAGRMPNLPELRADQAAKALRQADKINAKLKDKPVDALEAVTEKVPQADRLKSDKQKRARRVRRTGGVEDAFEPNEMAGDDVEDGPLGPGSRRTRDAKQPSAKAAPPERAAPLANNSANSSGKKKSVSTWQLLLAPPVVRKLELSPEQIERINKLQAAGGAEADPDLPFGFIRDASGNVVPDPRVAEVLTEKQLSLWRELIARLEPGKLPATSQTASEPATDSPDQQQPAAEANATP